MNYYNYLYLINQLLITSSKSWWIMILLEFDFKVVHHFIKKYIVIDYLSEDRTTIELTYINHTFNDLYFQKIIV